MFLLVFVCILICLYSFIIHAMRLKKYSKASYEYYVQIMGLFFISLLFCMQTINILLNYDDLMFLDKISLIGFYLLYLFALNFFAVLGMNFINKKRYDRGE